ncbi:MAG: hypothetical protein JO149_06250, partial [Gammaproteobacteria bacterium]|nr:hypothetical protein [Gammaproteobacteria bacterium]
AIQPEDSKEKEIFLETIAFQLKNLISQRLFFENEILPKFNLSDNDEKMMKKLRELRAELSGDMTNYVVIPSNEVIDKKMEVRERAKKNGTTAQQSDLDKCELNEEMVEKLGVDSLIIELAKLMLDPRSESSLNEFKRRREQELNKLNDNAKMKGKKNKKMYGADDFINNLPHFLDKTALIFDMIKYTTETGGKDFINAKLDQLIINWPTQFEGILADKASRKDKWTKQTYKVFLNLHTIRGGLGVSLNESKRESLVGDSSDDEITIRQPKSPKYEPLNQSSNYSNDSIQKSNLERRDSVLKSGRMGESRQRLFHTRSGNQTERKNIIKEEEKPESPKKPRSSKKSGE